MQMHKTTYETSKSREQRNWHPSYRHRGTTYKLKGNTDLVSSLSDNC